MIQTIKGIAKVKKKKNTPTFFLHCPHNPFQFASFGREREKIDTTISNFSVLFSSGLILMTFLLSADKKS